MYTWSKSEGRHLRRPSEFSEVSFTLSFSQRSVNCMYLDLKHIVSFLIKIHGFPIESFQHFRFAIENQTPTGVHFRYLFIKGLKFRGTYKIVIN